MELCVLHIAPKGGRRQDLDIELPVGVRRTRVASVPLRDYVQWLHRYDDPDSDLSWRLDQVQVWLRSELDSRFGPLRIVSACAGDGRDIIDVLAGRRDAGRVQVVLLERHPDVAELARRRARRAGLGSVTVRACDAADTANYVGAVPADIVLMVGMLGNMAHEEVVRTIAVAPQLCAPGAALVWSRGRDRDDINDSVRDEFERVGFSEIEYCAADRRTLPAVGLMHYTGRPVALDTDQHLFEFWR